MPILSQEVQDYLDGLKPERSELMQEMEALAASDHIPIVHWETGRFLAVLVAALGPERVLEVGTAIGYSTLHMAQALRRGRIVTIERDPVRVKQASGFFERGRVADRIEIVEADALEAIDGLDGPFDLLFLDATKGEYAEYLRLAESKASERAVLVIDNVLMTGSVAFPDDVEVPDAFGSWWTPEQRRDIRALSTGLINSDRWLSVVLPVGDGVAFAARR